MYSRWIHSSWWCCIGIFLVHQVVEKILDWHWRFADNHLDCLLCMPILLGGMLLERRFVLQDKTWQLPFFDVVAMVTFLAIFLEEGFPRWYSGFTYDYWDYCCYAIGGIYFHWIINKPIVKTK